MIMALLNIDFKNVVRLGNTKKVKLQVDKNI